MTKRTWLLLLLTAVLALCLAACSSSEETTTPTTTDTTPAAEPVDEVTEPVAEPEPVEPAPPAETDEEAALPPEGAFSDATTALAELNSYRYSTLFTFVGEEDGEVEAGSIELMGIVVDPDRERDGQRGLRSPLHLDLRAVGRLLAGRSGERRWRRVDRRGGLPGQIPLLRDRRRRGRRSRNRDVADGPDRRQYRDHDRAATQHAWILTDPGA